MQARAKSGRLYLVCSPTYQMLQDSTFRSFLQVAEGLGILDHKRVKHGAPPSAVIKTGAEILFRSADDPDKLRGPNLSGVWIDEGSLCHADTFNVLIGRLREAGEMGWLTCTTTPKGKNNWVYDVFGSGRPNTDLIRCRTADNPFLPQGFEATMAEHYTSHMAMQELEGLFVDSEGSPFKRAWFATIDIVPKSMIVSKVRAWDLAGTPKDERKSHDPDWTVGALLGKDKDGNHYLLDIVRLRGTPQMVEQAIKITAEMDGRDTAIWMEEEGGSSGKIVSDNYARRVLSGYNFRSERSTGDKATRAQPLAAASERGLVKIVNSHWNKAFLDEVDLFPYGPHDDQVDACSLAYNKLATKKQFWMRMGGVGGGMNPDKYEKEIQKLIDSGCKRLPNGQGIVRPDGVVQVIDLRPDAPGWQRLYR